MLFFLFGGWGGGGGRRCQVRSVYFVVIFVGVLLMWLGGRLGFFGGFVCLFVCLFLVFFFYSAPLKMYNFLLHQHLNLLSKNT